MHQRVGVVAALVGVLALGGSSPVAAATGPAVAGGTVSAPSAAAGTDPRLWAAGVGSTGSSVARTSGNGQHLYLTTNGQLNAGDPLGGKTYDVYAGGATLIGSSAITVVGSNTDGSVLVLSTGQALLPEDADPASDLYVQIDGVLHLATTGDFQGGTLEAMAQDGSAIIFRSPQTLFEAEVPAQDDLFRWTLATGDVEFLTPGTMAAVDFQTASPDMSRVLFSTSDDLAGLLGNTFTYGIYERVGDSYLMRGNGSFIGARNDWGEVYFATNRSYVAGDTDDLWDGYAWNTQTGVWRLTTPGTATPSSGYRYAADGSRWLVDTDDALVPEDDDAVTDIYLFSIGAPPKLIAGKGTGTPNVYGNDDLSVLVVSTIESLDPADADAAPDLYRTTAADPTTNDLLTGAASTATPHFLAVNHAGSRIVFNSIDSFAAEDTDTEADLYAWTPTSTILLTPGTPFGVTKGLFVADASRIVFSATKTTLPDTNGASSDAYVVDFDVTAPQATMSGPSGWSNSTTADFTLGSTGGDAARFTCELDGAPVVPCPAAVHLENLDSNVSHTLVAWAWDGFGNQSAPVSRTWAIDLTKPFAGTPTVGIPRGLRMGTSNVTVRLTTDGWSDSGSGVVGYRVEARKDGGAWTVVGGTRTATSTNVSLAPGHTWQLAIRAIDKAGNLSDRAATSTYGVSSKSEASSAITYRGTWTTASSTSYVGGKVRYAKGSTARASFSFTGRSVTWVSTWGPSRGWAEVWIDGSFYATIRLSKADTTTRMASYTMTWPTAGAHRIQVRVLGTPSSHPRIDVDSFVVLK